MIGATNVELMHKIKDLSENLPWLVPGIGAQGGDLEKALIMSNYNGLGLINVSRGILYAGNGQIKDIIKSAENYTMQIREIICNQVNY